MSEDRFRSTVAPMLFPEPLPVPEDLDALMPRLVRYQHGGGLLTLSVDEVPDSLASAFPLTSQQWERALVARADAYDTPETCTTVTFVWQRVVFRGSGLLCLLGEPGPPPMFVVRVARPSDGQRWSWLVSPRDILSVTGLRDPSDADPPHGYRVVPTLADACRINADVEVRPGEPLLVWHVLGGTRYLTRGRLSVAGPSLSSRTGRRSAWRYRLSRRTPPSRFQLAGGSGRFPRKPCRIGTGRASPQGWSPLPGRRTRPRSSRVR